MIKVEFCDIISISDYICHYFNGNSTYNTISDNRFDFTDVKSINVTNKFIIYEKTKFDNNIETIYGSGNVILVGNINLYRMFYGAKVFKHNNIKFNTLIS